MAEYNNQNNQDDSIESLLSYKTNLYEKLYINEIEHREQMSNKLGIAITVSIALFSAIIWLLIKFFKNFTTYNDNAEKITISILLGICIIIMGLIIKNYWCGFCQFTFTRVDPSKVKELVSENESYLNYYSPKEIKVSIDSSMGNSYIQAAIENYNNTIKHSKYVSKIYQLLVVECIVASVCLLLII